MARQVNWNKYIYDRFTELAMLSEIERGVLETRSKGLSITQQARLFNRSESTINNIVKQLKIKYDEVQKLPDSGLPVRRKSAKEEWMDQN